MNDAELLTERVMDWKLAYGEAPVSLADLLCDRHAGTDRIAVFAEDAAGAARTLTYAELQDRSARFAGVLRGLGIGKGDRVATLLPRTPELVVTVLAIWRIGAVHVPLFTALSAHAIAHRLEQNSASAIVTDGVNRSKIGTLREIAPRVVVIEQEGHAPEAGDIGFWDALRTAEPVKGSALYAGRDPMIVLYTAGTTGHPKGVPVPVKALAAIHAYLHFGLDIHGDDVYWNAADLSWAYGQFYGLIGPMLLGQSTILIDAPFDAERTERVWRTYGVTNFAATAAAYHALRVTGVPKSGRDGIALRVASSTGDPLDPDVIAWAYDALGVPLHDHYGLSEHGMLVNTHHHPALRHPVLARSIGHTMPGFEIVILDSDGAEVGADEEGQLAIDIARSPLFWFTGYLDDPPATARVVSPDGRFFLTGDTGSRDAEGYVTFAGRSDDLIDIGGRRIGPLDIERALDRHPAVAESAVVGISDELRGVHLIAFVVVKPGVAATPQDGIELGQFVEDPSGGIAYPCEVRFIEALPKTPSGNIQRYKLRALAAERDRFSG